MKAPAKPLDNPYSSPEFDEINFETDDLLPEEQVVDFLFNSDHMPEEIISCLVVTLNEMVERVNLRFHRSQVDMLQQFKSDQKNRDIFLRIINRAPQKIPLLQSTLALLYAQRAHFGVETNEMSEFQAEINHRNRAILEAFIELYEYAYRITSEENVPYVQKDIDFSINPVELPETDYPVDEKVMEVLLGTRLQGVAAVGVAMQEGHKVVPNLPPKANYVPLGKGGFNGLPRMDDAEDEVDFNNILRIAADTVHHFEQFTFSPTIASLLTKGLIKKFPHTDPLQALGSTMALLLGIPVQIKTSPEGVVVRKIPIESFSRAINQTIPEPTIH